jgi:malic enzyme
MFARSLKSTCAACVGTGLAAIGISEILNRSVALAEQSKEEKHKVLIIGGGTAGTTVANQIVRKVYSEVPECLAKTLVM